MNVILSGLFTLRSPLSHIGESISTTSYLVQEPILQPDGTLEEVFVYSGNAWRGQIRDLAGAYMLDKLGNVRLPPDQFHLIFSGGRIGGSIVVDIEHARRLRKAVPLIGILGGGVGNQILAGKLKVSNSYPLCREALITLPTELHDAAQASYRSMTFEKSFSRKDDAKDERLRGYLQEPLTLKLGTPPEKDGPADQMRMTSELVVAGVRLYSEIVALDVTEVELGCLVSALHAFSKAPHIGGQANKGHGKVSLDYNLKDMDTGGQQGFLRIGDGPPLLSPRAADALASYDQHLREQYDQLLTSQTGEIRALLGAA